MTQMGIFVESQEGAFWLDPDGKWRPEAEYDGDFAQYEGEWHYGWFARWQAETEGDWLGPEQTKTGAEALALMAWSEKF